MRGVRIISDAVFDCDIGALTDHLVINFLCPLSVNVVDTTDIWGVTFFMNEKLSNQMRLCSKSFYSTVSIKVCVTNCYRIIKI